jgi:hypothetical protein
MPIAALNWVLALGILMAGLVAAPAQLHRVGSAPLAGFGRTLSLAWDASPSEQAVGYIVYWGLQREGCTNRIQLDNVTNVTLAGFKPARTYYLAVAAHDATDNESPLSNVLEYSVPRPRPTAVTTNVIRWQCVTNEVGSELGLSIVGQTNLTYHLLATEDFQEWEIVGTTNSHGARRIFFNVPISGTTTQRFFRVVTE